MKMNFIEQHKIDKVTLDVLDKLQGESFEIRFYAEKEHKEKDYQSHSTLVRATEIEEAFEESRVSSDEGDFLGAKSVGELSNKDLEEDHIKVNDKM